MTSSVYFIGSNALRAFKRALRFLIRSVLSLFFLSCPIGLDMIAWTTSCLIPRAPQISLSETFGFFIIRSATFGKEPVAAGGKGWVTVTYRPLTSRGSFRKTVRIMLNGGTEYAEVAVKGKIRIGEKHP